MTKQQSDKYPAFIAQFQEFIAAEPLSSANNSPTEIPAQRLHIHADAFRAYEYPIFSVDDWVAYSAILQFYTKKYKDSFDSLKTLEKTLLLHKKNYFDSGATVVMDPGLEREIYEFRFSPMTFNECYYALLLLSLFLRDLTGGLKIVNQLLGTVKPQNAVWIILLRSYRSRTKISCKRFGNSQTNEA